MLVKTKNFSSKALDRFRELQTLSFRLLEDMASSLQAGQTEKEVARALVRQYRAAGVTSFFHLPVVLFGARTALPGDWGIRQFFPTSRALRDGDSVILDAAPLFDGYLVDTSYSCCFGENAVHRKMMRHLAKFRDEVCDAVNAGQTFRRIAENIEQQIRGQGYEPVHTKHPGEVLGHRGLKTVSLPFAWRMQGFDALTLGWFLLKGKAVHRGWSHTPPTWTASAQSDHGPHDGLWMVEPHAGLGEVGAKWEEMLVIDKGRARWLDETPPHVRQWAQIKRGDSYRPQIT